MKNQITTFKNRKSSGTHFVFSGSVLKYVSGFIFIVFILLQSSSSLAVPSFARQTGLACNSCHTVFPQLTTFGREFKLNGYTFTGSTTIEAKDDRDREMLKILASSPLSAMFQTSVTTIGKAQPETQNHNVEFPQQLSLFYSGLISNHLGTFIQLTYSGQDGTLGLDNTDIRFSNTAVLGTKRLIYGLTLNNNPTVQDVWNSIPAWRFPYATSAAAPSPAAAPLIDGGLAQQVAGLGVYGYFNSFIYLEGSLYRSAQQGTALPPGPASGGIIKGVAPYWRIALQHQWTNHYLEIGTTGMRSRLYRNGVTGNTDNYNDVGLDAQYELTFPKGSFVIHPTFFWENQKLQATYDSAGSANLSNKLSSFKISGELFFNKGIGLSLGYFATKGDKDDILYQPAEVSGSSNGYPNSNGLIAELDYLRWYNIRLSLQYIYYNKFNGASSNYDGFRRNASNNNTLYLLAWFNF